MVKKLSHLEITGVALVHCNILNNDYQHDSRVFYTFIHNSSFGQLFDISSENSVFLKQINSELSYHILRYGLLIKILN